MKLKKGVNVQGIRPEMILAIIAAQAIFGREEEILIITSIVDGEHSVTSLHYTGCAIDIRTRNLTPVQQKAITKQLKLALGKDYEVILEKTHIHIEYQPRYKK